MKFSVLMSVYYKEKPEWLEESIDSIYNQSCLPTQVVLVKDGPLGIELEKIIEKMQKKHRNFDIVNLSENKGLANALNEGLKYCKYDLVARMDTDDVAVYDRFEKQITEFKNDSELSLIGSSISEFTGDKSNFISRRIVPLTYNDIIEYSKKRNPFNHMTVMFKKKHVIEVGGYLESLYTEDYYLWVRLLKKYKCKNIDKDLVFVRVGDEMFARRGGFQYAMSDIHLQKKFYDISHISYIQMVKNILLRVSIRILPNKIRRVVYLKQLRKE